jgi:hypothetical protein
MRGGVLHLLWQTAKPNPLQGLPSLSSGIGFRFRCLDASVWLKDEQTALKGVSEEQTASLQTALLHEALRPGVRTQMRTAQRGSIPIAWTSTSRATKG